MTSQELLNTNLPDTPGVYFFRGPKKEILYIGKATCLKDRVRSYFGNDLIHTRGGRLVKMVNQAVEITYFETQSVLEALLVEASQIKKHLPPYNTAEKDNKSFNMVVITDEDFPQILIVRSRNIAHWDLLSKGLKIRSVHGPFPHGGELREALKIIRRIFPYRDNKCIPAREQKNPENPKPCFNAQIGLCPGVCAGWINKTEYRKIVKRFEKFFEGKREEVVNDIEKEMQRTAKEERFEDAQKLKKTLYALDHIQDMAMIKRYLERTHNADEVRIEAYDIAHLSGKDTVGVMVAVIDGEVDKSQYRKFRIRGRNNSVGINDILNLKEVLVRRLGHLEWDLPHIIVVDGAVAQINAAKEVLKERGFNIEVVAVVKDNRHKAKEIIGEKKHVDKWGMSILLANLEAHRFAINYHRRLRSKGFRI